MARVARQKTLPEGKVPPAVLREILSIPTPVCPELLVPPAPGEDGAVLAWPGDRLVVAGDPITFATPRPGHFGICVNANDVAVMGGRPRFFTVTLMLPPACTGEQIVGIMTDMIESANALDIVLVGGHTEITSAVTRPIVSITMFGELVREAPLPTGGGRVGDGILQVNPLAIEGTAILASEQAVRLRGQVGEAVLEAAAGLLDDPGILVVEPALALAACAEVHALHDPTEGGLATGLREMAEGAGLGLRIRESALLMRSATAEICASAGVDPLGLISSGCLLAAVSPAGMEGCWERLRSKGFEVAVIGEFRPATEGMMLEGADGVRELPVFAVDELAGNEDEG